MNSPACFLRFLTVSLIVVFAIRAPADELVPLKYNNDGLVVDLGVGLWAWPLPMDWDSDGDYDLIVACPDKPYSGTYFFENTTGNVKLPVFKPGVRVGPGRKNLQVSHVDGLPRVLAGATELQAFLGAGFENVQEVQIHPTGRVHNPVGRERFNVWSYVDFDGDGLLDVLVGTDDWGDYGWDEGFDAAGKWKMGALHGRVSILRNIGTNSDPSFAPPTALKADGRDIDVYGNPMPNLADFDGDGDLDLVCGEFLDGFNYFENVGSRSVPKFESRGYLKYDDEKIRMHVQMITPTAIDWDRDGDVDLVVGDEDGRVAFVENLGRTDEQQPAFAKPQYFQQEADDLKFGALVTPVGVDWDGDGDDDLVAGNTSGNIAWFENLDGMDPPRWSAPQMIYADESPIRIQAGENGSIQGPAEAKWGYTTISVADWDDDGLPDLILNSIWGRIEWLRNTGSRTKPAFAEPQPVKVQWQSDPPKPPWLWWNPGSDELATQWRTTPVVMDWNRDGKNDLLSLDHEGYLSFFEKANSSTGTEPLTLPGVRIFEGGHFDSRQRSQAASDDLLRLNVGKNGSSGRRKLCITDWDSDGRPDLLVNSINANWLRNIGPTPNLGSAHSAAFVDEGPVAKRELAGHTTSPTTVDWDHNGIPDLVLGAEDGRLYYLKNPHSN